ncbi:MAG: chloride channel protein [Candidatus Nanopelagicales bacterium]
MAKTRTATVFACLAVGIVALIAGFVVLQIIESVLDWLWFSIAPGLSTPLMWIFVLALPVIAGTLVAMIRKAGNDGHNPLTGIAMSPVEPADYPSIIGGIAITLIGGLVLGPEAAMVCTGAAVGAFLGSRIGLDVKTRTIAGIAGSVIALFIKPILHGNFDVASDYQFRFIDLIGAAFVGVLTGLLIWCVRWLAIRIGEHPLFVNPNVLATAVVGLLVGLLAMIYHSTTGHSVALVMTSGESNVKHLLAIGSVGGILLTMAFKWVGYALSMGGGFRGGPYFPAIFLGAGVGGIVTLIAPDIAHAGAAAGITAAVVYLAHPKWTIVVAFSIIMGLIAGGFATIPIAIVAGFFAKFVPEQKPNTHPQEDPEPKSTVPSATN